MVYWSAHTKRTLSFNCNNTRQDKTRQRRVRRLLVRVKARINDLQGVQDA